MLSVTFNTNFSTVYVKLIIRTWQRYSFFSFLAHNAITTAIEHYVTDTWRQFFASRLVIARRDNSSSRTHTGLQRGREEREFDPFATNFPLLPQRPNLGVPDSWSSLTRGCPAVVRRDIRRDVDGVQVSSKGHRDATHCAKEEPSPQRKISQNPDTGGDCPARSWRMLDVRTVDRKRRHAERLHGFTCSETTTAARLTSRERAWRERARGG